MDKEFGNRLKSLRKVRHLKQTQAAPLIGISYSTLQNHEAGKRPSQKSEDKYLAFYKCDRNWFLTGQGEPPIYKDTKPEVENHREVKYDVGKEKKFSLVRSPDAEYNAGSFGKASEGLKEIFDSQDPVLIPAIEANIRAFQLSVRRDRQIQQQAAEIEILNKRVAALEARHRDDPPDHDHESPHKQAI